MPELPMKATFGLASAEPYSMPPVNPEWTEEALKSLKAAQDGAEKLNVGYGRASNRIPQNAVSFFLSSFNRDQNLPLPRTSRQFLSQISAVNQRRLPKRIRVASYSRTLTKTKRCLSFLCVPIT